jgi:hypothetical protein
MQWYGLIIWFDEQNKNGFFFVKINTKKEHDMSLVLNGYIYCILLSLEKYSSCCKGIIYNYLSIFEFSFVVEITFRLFHEYSYFAFQLSSMGIYIYISKIAVLKNGTKKSLNFASI